MYIQEIVFLIYDDDFADAEDDGQPQDISQFITGWSGSTAIGHTALVEANSSWFGVVTDVLAVAAHQVYSEGEGH